MEQPGLVLYETAGCHLCEEAAALVRQVCPELWVERVEIAGDPALTAAYGVRVPVLKRSDTGAELGWPFDAASLAAFLGLDAIGGPSSRA